MELNLENYKSEIIAVIILACLAWSFSYLAAGSGLLPNITYIELGKISAQAGTILQFTISNAVISGINGMTGGTIEDSYRLALTLFTVIIALGAYCLGRARRLDELGALAASFAFTFSSLVLYSFALVGINPIISAAIMIWALVLFEASAKKGIVFSIGGAVLAMAAITAYPSMAYAGIALSIPLLLHAYFANNKKIALDTMMPGALLFITAIAGMAAFMPFNYTGAQNIIQFLSDSRITVAIAGMSLAGVIRKFSHEYDMQNSLSFLFAIAISFFSPFAAGVAMAYCSIAGIREAQGKDRTLNDTMASLFFAGFFAAVAFSTGAGWNALAFGAMLGAAIIAMIYLFKDMHLNMSAAVIVLFFVMSILSGAYLAGSKNIGATTHPGYDFSQATPDFNNAIQFLKTKITGDGTGQVATLENTQFAAYALGGKNVFVDTKPLATYLGSNGSLAEMKSKGVKYIIAGGELFSNSALISGKGGPAVRTRAYYFAGNSTGASADSQSAAYFAGNDGTVLIRPMDASGKLLVQASTLYSGNQPIAQVQYSELLLLNPDMAYQNESNLVVWPLSSYNTNLFKLFFGNPEGVRLAGTFGSVKVFEID